MPADLDDGRPGGGAQGGTAPSVAGSASAVPADLDIELKGAAAEEGAPSGVLADDGGINCEGRAYNIKFL